VLLFPLQIRAGGGGGLSGPIPKKSVRKSARQTRAAAGWRYGRMSGPVLRYWVSLQKTKTAKSMINQCGRIGSRRPDMPTGPGQQPGS